MVRNRSELFERRWRVKQKTDTGYGIPGLREYTGVGNPLGSSTCVNTPFAADQFQFALAMSKHPLVEDLISDESINPWNFNPIPFIEAKVLEGMKILDLGCGHQPTFARCSRLFGAEVYTVDRIPSSIFTVYNVPEGQREVEIQNHFQMELPMLPYDCRDIKIDIGEEDFDLVTEAHASTDGFHSGEQVAYPLLKEGGLRYKAGLNRHYNKKEKGEYESVYD